MLFRDRQDAGRKLAWALHRFTGQSDVLVLGLPRGGVPVALEVARHLRAPLDVLVVRKLGVPGHEELAMGAIASGGARVMNAELVRELGISDATVEHVTKVEHAELVRRELAFRGARPPLDVARRTVIVVDDGVATGATMRSAVAALQVAGAARVVVAVPLAASDALHHLRGEADEVVCLSTPEPFLSVGQWYEAFGQTSDDEVRACLRASTEPVPGDG